MSIAVGAAASVVGVDAQAAAKTKEDPDIAEMYNRLMTLKDRGQHLDTPHKYIVLLATATTQALEDEVCEVTKMALKAKVDPIYLRESIYQVAPYVGLGRVKVALEGFNEALKEAGIARPLKSQKTVNNENRLEKGIEVQVGIFGDAIRNMHKNCPENQKPLIIGDLSGYCFGDFYTRTGMSIKDRELVVFAAIAALGGCESQLKAHTAANIKEGNTKEQLIDALQVAVPLNGFPRTLNALAVVNAA